MRAVQTNGAGVHKHDGNDFNRSANDPGEPAAAIVADATGYKIHSFTRQNAEEGTYLSGLTDLEREAAVARWLGFGFAIDKRAERIAEVDYMEKETERLLRNVREVIEAEVRRRLDPGVENSFTRPLVEHAVDSKRVIAEAQGQLAELVRVNFDPNDARSVVAKIGGLLNGLQTQLDARFDPKRKDSVLGNIDQRLDTLIKRLSAPDGPFQPIATELQALRLQVVRQEAERVGEASVVEKTTAKGAVFEDEFESRLSTLARVYGDVVERTTTTPGPGGSKRGDFVIDLARGAGRIVVEAKGGVINSLPKLLAALDGARTGRSADLAIAVVRSAEDLPLQARPFQFYEEGIVVSFDNFEFAYRVARWVVVVQNQGVPDGIDGAAAKAAAADVIAALKHLRPTRAQLAVIEKAAGAIRDHLGEVEAEIIDAVKALEASLAAE